jgi:CBS domain-containing protein
MPAFFAARRLARKLLQVLSIGGTLKDLLVSQLMHPTVELDPDADVAFVLNLARDAGVHYFPLTRGGSLLGLVCTCDLDDAPTGQRVLELANRQVLTVHRNTKASDAAKAMVKRTVGSAVVMDGSHVCGLLTREDIERAAPELAELFTEICCAACGAAKHLRPWGSSELLCVSCAGRARAGRWLDVGGGD